MASLNKPNKGQEGELRVQFIGKDKKRHTIRIGKQNDRNAARLRDRIEALVTSVKTGAVLVDHTQHW